MANFHCSIKTVSRGKGQSAVASIAYRSGQAIEDNRIGLVFDYTKKQGIAHSEIVLPSNSPKWAKDSKQLWNNAEKAESKSNSVVARDFEISLPFEMTDKQRLDLSKDLSKNLVDRFGFAVQFSIHNPNKKNNDKNYHVHILATTRKIGKDGFLEKTRELDDKKSNSVIDVRKMTSTTINEHLKKAGINIEVDHRSLLNQQKKAIQNGDYSKALELSREPQRHNGKMKYWKNKRIENQNLSKKEDFNKFRNQLITDLDKLKITEIKSPEKNIKQENNKIGLLANFDPFGIKAAKKQEAERLEKLEEKENRKKEKAEKAEAEWQVKVESFNKMNEERFRSGGTKIDNSEKIKPSTQPQLQKLPEGDSGSSDIDGQIESCISDMKALENKMPSSPAEAAMIAEKIKQLRARIAQLEQQKSSKKISKLKM